MKKTVSVLLILILIVIFWPTDPSQLDSESSQDSRTEAKANIPNTNTQNSQSTRIIRARSKKKIQDGEIDPYQEWELSKILSHFMVPPGEFRAGNINDSIAKLKTIYHKYSNHDLEISLEAPVHPNEAISFQHDNISFRTLLGMVAGLSGYSVEVSSGEVNFTNIKPSPVRSAIAQTSPHALSRETFTEILDNPEKTREYLTSQGLHTPEVFGFPDDPAQLANLINSLQDARLDPENTPRQVRIQNKFLSFPSGFEFEATDLSDSELQVVIRDWSQMKGVDILTAPSVITLPGQDATIEIGQQILFPASPEEEGIRDEFVGVRVNAKPVLAGLDKIQIGGEVSLSSVDRERTHELNQGSFKQNITESEIHLYDGGHVLIPITGEDGAPTVQIISSQRIDAAGKPFWPPKSE